MISQHTNSQQLNLNSYIFELQYAIMGKQNQKGKYNMQLIFTIQYITSYLFNLFTRTYYNIFVLRNKQMKSYEQSKSTAHFQMDDSQLPIIQRIASRQCQQTEAVVYSSQDAPHYAYNGEQINPLSYNPSKQILKLKRLLSVTLPDEQLNGVLNITLKISPTHPIIYYECIHSMLMMIAKKTKYITLAQVIKKRPQLSKNKQIFYLVYDQSFPKVGKQFQCIAVFAENLLIRKGQALPIYYRKAINHQIQFIIFDCSLKAFEFNQNIIEKKKNNHKYQYSIYEQFIKSLSKEQKIESVFNLLHKYEAQSDEDQKEKNTNKNAKQQKEILKLLLNANQKNYVQLKEQLLRNIGQQTQLNEQSANYHRFIKQLQSLNQNWIKYNENISKMREIINNNSIQQSIEYQKQLIKKIIIKYKELFSKLPILQQKSAIIQKFSSKEDSQIILISSKTGSGKSTQLPQILCEYFGLFENQKGKPILVTQPTKMAVRNLAERVSKELQDDLGSFVDYATSENKAYNKDAKILFKLDSLAVTEMIDDPLLSKYSCLLIDEAHQRTLSIDILLGFVKEIVKKRPQFKVVVSSASLNIGTFQRYFNTKSLSIQGNNFPVKLVNKNFYISNDSLQLQSVRKIQNILNQQIFLNINETKPIYTGHILCFCSSIEQIQTLVKQYRQCLNSKNFSIHALHHRITAKQQRRIFKKTSTRKLIFTSKIAETAVSIDDIGVVIDIGLDMEYTYDRQYKISALKIIQISQSSAKQRLDNAVRTGPGYCFRLYSSDSYKNRRLEKIPQIQNSSLDTVILKLKLLKIQDIQNFEFMSQINKLDLEESIQNLKDIGALDESKELSLIGEMLCRLPVDTNLARVIIEAILFDMAIKVKQQQLFKKQSLSKKYKQSLLKNNIAENIVIIIAMLSNYSNLTYAFSTPKWNKYISLIGNGYEGDFLLMIKLYQQYDSFKHYFQNQQQYQLEYYNLLRFNNQYQQILRRKNMFGNLPQYMQYFQMIEPKRKYYQNIAKNHYHSPYFINQVKQMNYSAFCDVLEIIKEIRDVFNKHFVSIGNIEKQVERVCNKLDLCTDINQIYLSCIITSFGPNLCRFSGNKKIGYVSIKNQNIVNISPNSCLHKTGQQISNWIISYDYKKDKSDRLLCNIAQKVSFNFIEKHIDKVLLQKIKINNISQLDSLYIEKTYTIPTKILHQIQSQIQSQPNTLNSTILNTHPTISQKDNKISFYLLKQSQQPYQKTIYEIEQYMTKIKESYYLPFSRTYSKYIIASFNDGLQLKNLEFKQITQICYEITAKQQIIKIIQQSMNIHTNCVRYNLSQTDSYKIPVQQKIKLFLEDSSVQKPLLNLLSELKSKQNSKLQFKKIIVNRQKQSIVYLHFYAGISDENQIYLHYDSQIKAVQSTSHLRSLIKIQNDQFQQSQRLYQMPFNGSLITQRPKRVGLNLNVEQIRLSQSQLGVNIFNIQYDEYQIYKQLKRLDQIGSRTLRQSISFPNYITSHRQPVQPESLFTDQQWSSKIIELIDRTGCKVDDVNINIKGIYYPPSDDSSYKGPIYSSDHRVNMVAIIQTKNNEIFEKLKSNYDNKIGVLGFDKLHVEQQYCQSLSIDKNLFEVLEEEYEMIIRNIKSQSPRLRFSHNFHSQKLGDRVKIIISSYQKSDFQGPLSVIQNIFIPKKLSLTPLQFKLLRDTQQGQNVINYLLSNKGIMKRINHFQFDQDNNQISIYCNPYFPFYDQLFQSLKMRQMTVDFQQYWLKYDGINLHKILQIFYDLKKEKDYIVFYQIIYEDKRIVITSQRKVYDEIIKKVQQIPKEIKDGTQCHLCCSEMIMPYKLINCGCTFCWNCISAYLESTKDSSITAIYCPSQGCRYDGKVVNINDIKYLVKEEVFINLCRLRIKKYGMENYEEYQCCRYCDYFFSRSKIVGDKIYCQCCQMYFCLKCQKSHNTFTCQQYQSGEYTKKLGIKRCPRCRQGIQKNMGCDHMVCSRCRAQICWRCMKCFESSTECIEHLKSCGLSLEREQREL